MTPRPHELRAPFARFDDARTGRMLRFDAPRHRLRARTPAEVVPVLRQVEVAVAAGSWAVGMIAYEAAPGLDPAARTRPGVPDMPLVDIALCGPPAEEASPALAMAVGSRAADPRDRPYRCEPWRIDWTREQHAARVDAVRAGIAAGRTYQTNLTTRLRSRITGDLHSCYLDLIARQHGAYGAYLDLGRWTILSASPEGFLERDGDQLTSVPMKGTAPRDPRDPAAGRDALLASAKDRAENIMITDLLRNDLARIAAPGSVGVRDLLHAEEYPTLWTLTSTVTARAADGVGLPELLTATFPCGSITGAPKISTMGYIADLEDAPRGVYCGAIGFWAPATAAGDRPRMSLSVAIRTITVDTADSSAVYGAGGGITWDSRPEAEYDELLIKARVLDAITTQAPAPTPTPSAPSPGSASARDAGALPLETFAVRDGRPVRLRQHLARLLTTADALGVPCDAEAVERAVLRGLTALPGIDGDGDGRALVRLTLAPDGTARLAARPYGTAPTGPVRLAIDTVPVRSADPALRRKSTERSVYDAARTRHPGADDVVLVNEHARVTETTVANLLVRLDGRWWTPPIADGLLPGIGRRLVLDAGEAAERPITVDELRAAESIELASSARGRRPAVLVAP